MDGSDNGSRSQHESQNNSEADIEPENYSNEDGTVKMGYQEASEALYNIAHDSDDDAREHKHVSVSEGAKMGAKCIGEKGYISPRAKKALDGCRDGIHVRGVA